MKEAVASAIAEAAAKTRWDEQKKFEKAIAFDWQAEPLETCRERCAALLAEYQRSARIIQQRSGSTNVHDYVCAQCEKRFEHRPACLLTGKDSKTNLYYPIALCDVICHEKYQTERLGGIPK